MTTNQVRELLGAVAASISERFTSCGPINVEAEQVKELPGQFRLTFVVTVDVSDRAMDEQEP